MALPQKTASLEKYYESTVYITATLALDSATEGLISPFSALETENLDLQKGLRLARTQQIRAYARVERDDLQLEDLVRDLAEQAKSSDRQQPTLQAHKTLFPSGGYSGLLQPSGRRVNEQLKDIRSMFPILQELGKKEPAFLDHAKRLEAKCTSADDDLLALDRADQQLDTLYTNANLFRNRWREQAYLLEAELLKLYPGRRDIVRSFFETPTSHSPSEEKKPNPSPAP